MNSENLARLDGEYAVSEDGSEESFHSAVDVDIPQIKFDVKYAIKLISEKVNYITEEREAADLRALMMLEREIEEGEEEKDGEKIKQSGENRARSLCYTFHF